MYHKYRGKFTLVIKETQVKPQGDKIFVLTQLAKLKIWKPQNWWGLWDNDNFYIVLVWE